MGSILTFRHHLNYLFESPHSSAHDHIVNAEMITNLRHLIGTGLISSGYCFVSILLGREEGVIAFVASLPSVAHILISQLALAFAIDQSLV